MSLFLTIITALCCWYGVESNAVEDEMKLTESLNKSSLIKNRYIAVFKENCTEEDMNYVVAAMGQAVRDGLAGIGPVKNFSTLSRLTTGIMGIIFDGDKAAAKKLKELEQIAAVENDQFAQGQQVTQRYPLWYLDRVDQRSSSLNNNYYTKYNGKGNDIYILDSGIHYQHSEFEGRAYYGGYDAIDFLDGTNRRGYDCNGHGTHVAALAAGRNYGVAKKARIYSIRVLDCTLFGPYSALLAGLDYTIRKIRERGRKAVVSMSLSGPRSPTLDAQVRKVVQYGVPVVVAAGNSKRNACNFSPSSAAPYGIITAGGTKQYRDGIYFGTNYGPCVSIMAPGQDIRSATHTCSNCWTILSGTSMSTPLVSGAISLLQQQFPRYSVAQLKAQLLASSTKNAIDMSGLPSNHNTPNRLLYIDSQITTTQQPTTLPTIQPTTSIPTTSIPKPVLLPPSSLSTNNRPRIFDVLLTKDIEEYYFYQIGLNYTLIWLSSYDVIKEQRFTMVLNDQNLEITECLFQVDKQQLEFNIQRFALDGYHVQILTPYLDTKNITNYMAIFYKNNIDTKVFLGDSLQVANGRLASMKQQQYELKYFLNEPGDTGLTYTSLYIKSPRVNWIKYEASAVQDFKNEVSTMEKAGYYMSSFDAKGGKFILVFSSRRYGSGLYKYIFDQSRVQLATNVKSLAGIGWQPTLIAIYEPQRYHIVFLTILWK